MSDKVDGQKSSGGRHNHQSNQDALVFLKLLAQAIRIMLPQLVGYTTTSKFEGFFECGGEVRRTMAGVNYLAAI